MSTPVRMRRQQLEEGKQPLENMGAGVFSPACLLCGMGDGIELNVEGFCQDCLGVAPVKESYADELKSTRSSLLQFFLNRQLFRHIQEMNSCIESGVVN